MINSSVIKAIKKASIVRSKLGFDLYDPVNIFDACVKLGVNVRFVDVNMEGMYISHEDKSKSTILISNKRPLPRRIFTCAHELGHHIFEHGSKIDGITDGVSDTLYNDDEFLADTFAAALLMPITGIQFEFLKRGWVIQDCTPVQFFVISSVFGVGYSTLITHCRINKLIDDIKVNALLKITPAKILETALGMVEFKSHLKILDKFSPLSVIDLEVSNYIILPINVKIESNHLKEYQETDCGRVFIAIKPGITRAVADDDSFSYFIRIQNINYMGLSENRHLENKED